MNTAWKKVKIKDIGNVITGNTPPRKNPEFYGNHTLFIKPTDIQEDVRYTKNPEECYSELGFKKYKNSLIPKGSTCVVTIGSIGKKMTQAHCDCFVNQAVNAVVPSKEYDENFVYYLLKYNLNQVKGLDSGTASGRENVSKTAFSNIEVSVPNTLETQTRIANILSAYDDLIENNLRRIKLLEEMAELTYREWFVNFTIDGKTLEIDKITGLPFSWERRKIGSLIDKVKSSEKILSSNIKEIGQIPVIDQSRDFIAGYTDVESAKIISEKPIIVFGDHTRILKFINFDFARGADGTQLIISNTNKMPQHLFYQSLLNIDLSNYHYARHFKFLKEEEIIVPNENISRSFEYLIKPNYDQIKNLIFQNRLLKESRDILLPRLMSGELEV